MSVDVGQVPGQRTDGPGDLVVRARAGDDDAWVEIVQQHTALLWSITRSFRLSDDDSADVIQTTWLRLTENLGRLTEPEHVTAWLGTTTRRECMRVIQATRRVLLIGDDVVLLDKQPTPDEAGVRLLALDDAATLRAALLELPAHWQLLMELLMLDPPATYLEIAEDLGIPVGSIGPTRQRCLRRLRDLVTT